MDIGFVGSPVCTSRTSSSVELSVACGIIFFFFFKFTIADEREPKQWRIIKSINTSTEKLRETAHLADGRYEQHL